MKSFLQQLEEAFELYEESDELIQDSDNEEDDADLEEQNVTGAIAGFSTPNAFRKKAKKVGYASGLEESVTEVMDRKYEQLIEGYRNFANGDSKITPEKKVKSTIQEIAKKLQEIETLVNYNSRLKTESGVTSNAYGPSTTKALTKISQRLIKISERVRSLGE